MFRNKKGKKKAVISALAVITALILTACSCSGVPSLRKLLGGNSPTEISTETIPSPETTKAAESETTEEKAVSNTETESETTETTSGKETEGEWPHGGSVSESTAEETSHEHNWERFGGGPPGCTEDGAKTYVCKECGATYDEILPALGHDWVFVYHMPENCVDRGYDKYQCTRCGEIIDTDEDLYPPLGHNHDGLIADYAEGKQDTGHVEYCTNCGMEYYDTYEVHDYSDIIYIPYPGEESVYHAYYCLKCDYINVWSKAPHTMMDGKCTECGYSGPLG